ncbi:MAG: fatty acid desaturase, partial [Saprospiraceae bacterium]
MQEDTKIKFQRKKSNFYEALSTEVNAKLSPALRLRAKKTLHLKLMFYSFLFVGCYSFLFTNIVASHYAFFVISYTLFGLSGILLAFNASHDAVHHTLFRNKTLNEILHYLIFNLQGVNATLWKNRHLASHHIFPNVAGCDADIDDNPFIRLSDTHPQKKLHRFQHLYALFLYCLYTLHWILIKDFVYLRKKRVANMTNLHY